MPDETMDLSSRLFMPKQVDKFRNDQNIRFDLGAEQSQNSQVRPSTLLDEGETENSYQRPRGESWRQVGTKKDVSGNIKKRSKQRLGNIKDKGGRKTDDKKDQLLEINSATNIGLDYDSSPEMIVKGLASLKAALGASNSTQVRSLEGQQRQDSERLTQEHSNEDRDTKTSNEEFVGDSSQAGQSFRRMSSDDDFSAVTKSPIVTVHNMEDDAKIQLKLPHSGDIQATSPPTNCPRQGSSGNKKRSSGLDHNHAMTDDYSSTNSNSLNGSLNKKELHGSLPMRMVEDNGTCSDDCCDDLESGRRATKKQSTIASDVNIFDSQSKNDSHGLEDSQKSADRLGFPCQAGEPTDSLLLRQVQDSSGCSLRVKKQENCYPGDRFIPLRSGEQSCHASAGTAATESECSSNQQLQFQHEENMLRCHTQIRRSKKRHEMKSKTKGEGAAAGADYHYDPLMSPSFDNDFIMADSFAAAGGEEELSGQDSSPGNQSKTNSKGSPNEEKNKQIYRHLLAQQCLGDEIFNLNNSYQNLSSAALTLPQGYLNTQLDLNAEEEARSGQPSAALKLGSHSMFLDPSLGGSHLAGNDFTDPFASGSLLMRNTTESAVSRLTGSPQSASTAPGGSSSDSASGNLCIQSRGRILKHSAPDANQIIKEAAALPSQGTAGGALVSSEQILNTFDDAAYNPMRLGGGDFFSDGYDQNGMDLAGGFPGDSDDRSDFGKPRRINKMPYKVLDAPQLQDDFYLNLVDWSSTNVLAVGLNRAVYVWSACTSQVKKLCEVGTENKITSVGWSNKGNHLAVGTDHGETQIWDINHGKQIRSLREHTQRISSIAWNGSTISTGSKDKMVLNRDLRMRNSTTHRYAGHKQEVCGLRWSHDGQ